MLLKLGGFALSVLTCAMAIGQAPPVRVLQLEPVAGRPHPPVVTALAYNRSQSLLAAGGDDHSIRLIKMPEGTLVRVLAGHEDWVRTLDFSADGNLLVSAGNDSKVLVWRRDQDWSPQRRDSGEPAIACAKFCPEGRMIATAGFRSEMHLLGVANGQTGFDCGCTDMRSVAFTSDCKYVVVGGRTGHLHVINAQGLTLAHEWSVHKKRLRQLEIFPGTSLAVSCSEDGTVVITDVTTGSKQCTVTIPGCKLYCLVPINDQWIAVGGSDNQVHIIDITKSAVVASWPGHTGSVAALALCGNELVSASYDTTLRVWDLTGVKGFKQRVAGEAPAARTSEVTLPSQVTPR